VIDRLPVAVSFSPPVSVARRRRDSALAATADPETSVAVKLGSYEEFADNDSGVDYRMDESLLFLAQALSG
jgi:hypothetical protein